MSIVEKAIIDEGDVEEEEENEAIAVYLSKKLKVW